MFTMCDEMWNSVDIYGSQAEIERFKRLCVVPGPINDWEDNELAIDLMRIPGHGCSAWNFRELGRPESGKYSFAFDTVASFPSAEFEELARLFPRLAFDCECIADDDRSMGYGWFNTPPGGEDFYDDYEVPKNYWTTGVYKRPPAAQKRHEAVIAALKQRLHEMAGGGFDRYTGNRGRLH